MPIKLTRNPTAEMLAQFDALQKHLVPLWKNIGRHDPGSSDLEDPNTIVVLPSLTAEIELDSAAQQGYEERFLFMLFLLRQPHVRMIYLTSITIPPEVIDYYLDILPSVNVNHARHRLFLVSPQDSKPYPLVQKLLDRPRLLAQIRSLIPDPERAHLVPFITTDLERELAVKLGIPMYAADPRYYAFGTKSGCRQVFKEEGVAHPLGVENLSSEADLIHAVVQMRKEKPSISAAIVKHNEGASGHGNAWLDLSRLPEPGSPGEESALVARLREMSFELPKVDYEWYMERMGRQGGIIEELIAGEQMVSPSVQLRITPLGDVQLLSTHDQMLGGPSGQTYLGARFPANPEYGPLITREALKVGDRFAREGVIGRFALDFLVVRSSSGNWEPYAIEVNLRKGGTTHPFLTLQYLTDGEYNPETGVFRTSQGHPKYYVATDTLSSTAYRVYTAQALINIVSEHRLHYDHIHQTGVVLHMFSPVAAKGRLGLTAIGNSPEHAELLYQNCIALLDSHAT